MFLLMESRSNKTEETLAEAASRLLARLDARREREKASERLEGSEKFQAIHPMPQWVGEGQVAGLSLVIRYLPDRPVAPEAELPIRIRVAANCNRRVHLRPHLGYGSE